MTHHPHTTGTPRELPDRVPKVCGADVELGNFVLGMHRAQGTGHIASKLLLREVSGVPHSSWATSSWNSTNSYTSYGTDGGASGNPGSDGANQYAQGNTYDYNVQDWGRRFLASNGGCVYIDLHHLEICIPEVRSAYDYVAAWHAMLLVARQAMDAANAKARSGLRLQVLVNNSDGLGNSYGGHFNCLLSRRAWDNVFERKPHYMAYLASYQVSSMVLTGQGKVGSENGTPPVDYQISQRADFFERMTGTQTTMDRPLVNSRDEPLCGNSLDGLAGGRAGANLARLHCIFYDSNLCQVASLLKCGMMQIVLAMLEAGWINAELILDDPLGDAVRFSHDPTLRTKARTASRQRLTAVELLWRFLEEAQEFCDRGGCDGVVPRAGEILSLCADTLQKLRAGELDAVAGRLDWVLKLRVLERAMTQRPELTWDSPELKHLDHLYASLDPDEGLYWAYERAGVAQRVVSAGQIERFVHQPPEDTRAWTRAMLLRLAGPERISRVDWDSICFKLPGRFGWPTYRTLEFPDPVGLTKAATCELIESGQTLDELLYGMSTIDAAACGNRGTSAPPAGRTTKPSPPLLPAPQKALADDRTAIQASEPAEDQKGQPPREEGGQDDAIA